MFEIKKKDGLARIGDFETPSGTVETPAIMPVINPNLKLIPMEKLRNEFDIQILITNSYIIYRNEELRKQALEGGIHGLLDFQGPIMTDSGTFQAHVYGDVEVGPEEILSFQKKIGSDISTILDEFTEPDDHRNVANKKVEITVERAKKAKEMFSEEKGHIAYPIQGSVFTDLRKRCGKMMGELNGDFYPIGGVVPLMESYRFSDLTRIILSSKQGLGPTGPVHLFGAGHPMIYSLAVLLGCDLFDSSSYAKYAKRGDVMFPEGTKNLSEIHHMGCECPVCVSHTVQELKGLDDKAKERALAQHNLWISLREIKKVKQAIIEGDLWELVERRVRGHPDLLESLEVLKRKNHGILSRFDPRSRRKAIFYIGRESFHRPSIKRLQDWIRYDYSPPSKGPTIFFHVDEKKKPYHRHLKKELSYLEEYATNYLVSTPFGPVPLEMDEVYPVAQSIFPPSKKQEDLFEAYKEKEEIDEIIPWEGKETLGSLSSSKAKLSLGEMMVKSVSDYQFFKGAGDILSKGDMEFVKNRKGRIKNVILDGEHILSVRHYDGLFTLKKPGARILWEEFSTPELRIIVTDDRAKFNSEGKNVFAKFVKDMDERLMHRDEAIVVTQNDRLVATARVFLIREEVEVFDKGLAAKTREGFELEQDMD